MGSEKNIYGLAEGVFKACEFLGLEMPAALEGEHVPSDYFGADFELDSVAIEKICAERNWSRERFDRIYKNFAEKFATQKPLKQTKTDLNIYFCDFVLFVGKKLGASSGDYFDFEFYNKSFELRSTFLVEKHFNLRLMICNDSTAMNLVNNKAKANALFANFLRRDWLDISACTFEDFKLFAAKHPRFIAKPIAGAHGKGIKIIEPNKGLQKVFAGLNDKKILLEEIIAQHEELNSFCPDSLNTIRVFTILDSHNVARILTATGRFGRVGNFLDNPKQGGCYVAIDPMTGVIISDAINIEHERFQAHPDTGKIFKGFQYPAWKKLRAIVKTMAKMIPQLRHVAWDIAINDAGEPVLVEANGSPAVDVQQAADSVGKLNLYQPLLDELQTYKENQMRRLGWRVNNLQNVTAAYETLTARKNSALQYAMSKLIPDCESLLDVGCRQDKSVKALCPANVKYIPVDFKKYDAEIISCDFDKDEFPDVKVDVCFCAFTAEFVRHLPQFFGNMCRAAQRQILIWACPVDREVNKIYRWRNPFQTDFTEEFLIKTLAQNNFQLAAQYPDADNPARILYDFRRI